MITDQQQRAIYEWFYPELVTRFVSYENAVDLGGRFAPLLYMPDGKPNYQFFITEIVPRLHDDGWHIVVADSCVHNATIISRYDNPHIGFTDPDPWFALSELLESK